MIIGEIARNNAFYSRKINETNNESKQIKHLASRRINCAREKRKIVKMNLKQLKKMYENWSNLCILEKNPKIVFKPIFNARFWNTSFT